MLAISVALRVRSEIRMLQKMKDRLTKQSFEGARAGKGEGRGRKINREGGKRKGGRARERRGRREEENERK